MSLEPNSDLLTTETEWDLLRMLRSLRSNRSDVCLIRVISKNSSQNMNEEIGHLIHEVWDSVTGCLPDVIGHRLMWTSLLFVCSDADSESFKEFILNAVRLTKAVDLESQALFSVLDQTIVEREAEIDRMVMQLAKLDYWEEHIYNSYYSDGEEVTLNTSVS